ncbi:early nodulin-like protein 15 [Cornus florida]|uniref:early nodulin-like protein 15 n=1 Tax=Cornus florida TaxID=4283 RepID=UPI00289EF546|nr:early nodulin-like protein 15 [Cornus florida]
MASSSRALVSTLVLSLLLFISFSEARDHLVGGKTEAWKVPSSQSDSLNKWAENSRFLVGDSLVWKYDSEKDSVLQVTKRGYATCNTSSPIEEYKDGNTKVTLDQSGPYYFISGAAGNCEKGQKLIVVVMSATHKRLFTAISPAPSPVEFDGPAVAPTSGASSLQGSLMMVLVGWLVLMRVFGF